MHAVLAQHGAPTGAFSHLSCGPDKENSIEEVDGEIGKLGKLEPGAQDGAHSPPFLYTSDTLGRGPTGWNPLVDLRLLTFPPVGPRRRRAVVYRNGVEFFKFFN